MPELVARHAAKAAGFGHQVGERFCRGLFPDPQQVLQIPSVPDSHYFRWYRKPEDGIMQGDIYLDGSCIFPRYRRLRRAGWAVTCLNERGHCKCAAYGAVPRWFGPEQTARDGEDWAAIMLGQITMGKCHFKSDCKGTVNLLQHQDKACNIMNPRRRGWTNLWTHLKDMDFEATWIPGHTKEADVAAGKISALDRAGNDAADGWAKVGAKLQAPKPEEAMFILGCYVIANQVAYYVGGLEAERADKELWDADHIRVHVQAEEDSDLEIAEEPPGGLWGNAGPQQPAEEEAEVTIMTEPGLILGHGKPL